MLRRTEPGKCGEVMAVFEATVASLEDGLRGLNLEDWWDRKDDGDEKEAVKESKESEEVIGRK